MNSRLKEIRKSLKMTQKDLGAILGITNSGVSDIEKGKAALTERNISLLHEKLNVNELWLRTGEGEPFLPELPKDEYSVLLANLDLENNKTTKMFLEMYEQLDEKSQEIIFDLAKSLLDKMEKK